MKQQLNKDYIIFNLNQLNIIFRIANNESGISTVSGIVNAMSVKKSEDTIRRCFKLLIEKDFVTRINDKNFDISLNKTENKGDFLKMIAKVFQDNQPESIKIENPQDFLSLLKAGISYLDIEYDSDRGKRQSLLINNPRTVGANKEITPSFTTQAPSDTMVSRGREKPRPLNQSNARTMSENKGITSSATVRASSEKIIPRNSKKRNPSNKSLEKELDWNNKFQVVFKKTVIKIAGFLVDPDQGQADEYRSLEKSEIMRTLALQQLPGLIQYKYLDRIVYSDHEKYKINDTSAAGRLFKLIGFLYRDYVRLEKKITNIIVNNVQDVVRLLGSSQGKSERKEFFDLHCELNGTTLYVKNISVSTKYNNSSETVANTDVVDIDRLKEQFSNFNRRIWSGHSRSAFTLFSLEKSEDTQRKNHDGGEKRVTFKDNYSV